ncbi:hypothetical protein NHH03_15885 [Stieleria sp. TO1_6]|uniref:WD40 repeat domain-containing protein n=1 Tax=Stieleria tagensis TaxID=2956795 RepID=UPI00209B943C|nr:hypothetical protein [Stieleria tagensis]MCO8123229.1 hypothetical protein [Stieleria tagensis]
MKTRCIAALFLSLLTVVAGADEGTESPTIDTESVWITAIEPIAEDRFVAGSATGLLLRPGAVSRGSVAAPNQLEELYQHPAAVWTVAVTSDGKTIASADYRGNLIVYDVESKQATTHENAFERWCQKIVITPDDKTVLAGNESGKLFAWSLADAKVSKTVELGDASITSLAISPDQSQLAASDGDGNIHLLKLPELETVGVIKAAEETVWCLIYENNDSLIAGSADRNLYRVAAKPDAKAESITKGSDWITRIAVSPDGQIAASEVSGKIHFASGGSVTTIGAESGVWALCFKNSGQLFAGTRKNGIVVAGQSWNWNPVAAKSDVSVDEPAGEEAVEQAEPETDTAEQPEAEATEETP